MHKINLQNIKGVVFDLGFTLVEYRNPNWPEINLKAKKAAYNRLSNINVQLPPFEQFDSSFEFIKEEYRRSAFEAMKGWKITDVLEDLFNEYESNNPEELAQIFIKSFYAPGRDVMYVNKGSIDTLKLLRDCGYKMGIISNTNFPGYLIEDDMERFGLKSFFDFTIFSSEFGRRKPHRKIFEEGIRLMRFSPFEIMYVGDRYNMDALGSRAVGMQPILKYCGKRDYPDPMPDDIPMIYNIEEIISLLPEKANRNTTLKSTSAWQPGKYKANIK